MSKRKEFAGLISDHRAEITERWLERVRAQLVDTEIDLTQLRNAMPEYLEGVVQLFGGEGSAEGEGQRLWADVAREHAVTRVRLGFDIDELVHEFIVLRQVIVEVACEHELGTGETMSLLADVIEGAIAVSVRTYVESRDFEMKRAEAQHVAFVAHELRNPLTTATLALSLLRRTARLDPPLERLLGAVERSHTRLKDLIARVLEVERLEAGQEEYTPIETRLDELVEEAIAPARDAAREKGLAFQVKSPPGIALSLDRRLTSSAVHNLVENAVKYTEKGRVDVEVARAGDGVVIHVRDTCGGLTEDQLRTIFEPFRRGPHRREAGTGLGLAIAKKAVEAQGGRIQAESGSGGCHFWLTLPRQDVEREEASHGPDPRRE